MDIDKKNVDKRAEWLQTEQSSAAGDVFGEPQKTPRIGDEYQAQIPSLMEENERFQSGLPVYHDAKTDMQNQFEFGLSIPIIWVPKSRLLGSGKDNDLLPVPGSSDESWNVIEHDSFLLGLYIFGKNLRIVNKFVGNKGMPNVLSYYYGKFYRSCEHQKWSTYRKKRSRKSVPGKKIFNGWRRQELLSRLLPDVTDECKTSLTQITRTFEEGNLSFEKYVLTLRDTVGIDLLVEAVAIGKEKRDLLTSRAKKPLKNKKLHSTCSSLETEEILNLLKDGIGLSKERLNDLFWEAVWPRLLARGWHSEQPRNYLFQKSKHSLVFLAPGVEKFSRRSLERGSQYFDSFTDVLNKVASEPQLLDREPDLDQVVHPCAKNGSDDKQDLVKYTIVDTSLVGAVKVKKLRSLPVFEPADIQGSTSVSGDTEPETAEESRNKDVNHGGVDSPDSETTVNHLDPVVSRIEDKKMDISTNGQSVRKLKLIFKSKAKRLRITNLTEPVSENPKLMNTRNETSSGEDEATEKKRKSIVIDLNNPRVGVAPGSDGDGSLVSGKPSVFPEPTSSQPNTDQYPVTNGQRQSTRNRPLTTKALEALANGFLNPKKKRRGLEDRSRRRVRAKTALVSSCGARFIENRVEGVFNGSSHMVSESPK
ncbi:hypothetical protein L6452_43328 [Arctium lappa]|uniref:Uncharacterized protein n=1 Tax=Arctium lappa TaxID=4217 RepID=A0ACB8XPU7_ARCLA|nr:hypothetical protein L6452_43328 [Arctium lappa]